MSEIKKSAFCTIITPDYINYALVLYKSLIRNIDSDFDYYVLITEDISPKVKRILKDLGIKYTLGPEAVNMNELGGLIYDKYYNINWDSFRWSMKSIYMHYLIDRYDYHKVVYLDSDLYFTDDGSFLLDELNENSILLTPHWRSSDPTVDEGNFNLLFNQGLYNAGFLAVNNQAKEAMLWWAKMCLFRCENRPEYGQFVDQTYLNLFHILFDKVKVLKHKGCNVAYWNRVDCKREIDENGAILINGKFPVVFIHFTTSTLRGILNGKDSALKDYFDNYMYDLDQVSKEYDLPPIHSPRFSRIKSEIDGPIEKAQILTRIVRKIKSYL